MEKEIKFEVGKKYCFRDELGWAKFIAYVPEAAPIERLVFVTNKGGIITRCEDGRVVEPKNLGIGSMYEVIDKCCDVLPIEYKEPITFKYWINIYPKGVGGSFNSKEEADEGAVSRIACICIEGKEGDGLINEDNQ